MYSSVFLSNYVALVFIASFNFRTNRGTYESTHSCVCGSTCERNMHVMYIYVPAVWSMFLLIGNILAVYLMA